MAEITCFWDVSNGFCVKNVLLHTCKKSHPDYGGDPETGEYKGNAQITAEQFRNRMILREAKMRHGFKPYSNEWWHFTLKNEPFPDTYFTFPVKRLPQ